MDWQTVLKTCGVAPATAAAWAPHFEVAVKPELFSLGDDEVPEFVSNVLHESQNLERMEEGLNYRSAERIAAVWPRRFPTVEAAVPYVRNPVALANRVYGGRMGNVEPGDGWKYRGSGPIQVTGRDNFAALQDVTGLPLVDNPDMLRRTGVEALMVAVAWWEGHVPDAVMGDRRRVRRAVNGGELGLADVCRLADLVEAALA